VGEELRGRDSRSSTPTETEALQQAAQKFGMRHEGARQLATLNVEVQALERLVDEEPFPVL